MKTQEERIKIFESTVKNTRFEQLSMSSDIGQGIIMGYTQCQEDNKDKKYTEEDIRKAIEVGVNAEAGDYPKGFTYKLGITLEDYFINSLNKQD